MKNRNKRKRETKEKEKRKINKCKISMIYDAKDKVLIKVSTNKLTKKPGV